MNTRRIFFLGAALLGVLGTVIGLRGRGTPTAGAAIPQAPAPLRAEGRLAAYPGADVTLGTDLGGTLVAIFAQEGQAIHKGQLLVQVDSRADEASHREALAKVKELDADIAFQEREAQRQTSLHREGVASRQALEQTRNQLDLAIARRDAARATAERLGVVLAKLGITAPFDGTLLTRLAQPGETVAAGSPLLRVARLDRVRVEAEVDEFDLSRIRLSSPVKVRAEGMAGFWRGHVEGIPDHVIGRKLKPQDPARPSDTRILLVKVVLDQPTPLKLGQRVELELEP
jgi:HlyD family secretion protein